MTSPYFDDSALRQAVDPAAAKAEGRASVVAERRVGERRATISWAVVQSVVLIAGFGLLGSLLVLMVQSAFGGATGPSTFVFGALMVLPLAVMRVRAVRDGLFRSNWVAQYRLRRFAAANHLTYVSFDPAPDRVASMMRRHGGTSVDVLFGDRPRPFRVGLHFDETGTVRFRMSRTATYLHIPLQAALPAFTLAGRSAAEVAQPGGGEVLELDGPLATRFFAYCSASDAQAVRRLLGSAVQDRLVDVARFGAVEVIDDALVFLIPTQTRIDAPDLWEWIADAIDLVGEIEQGAAEQGAVEHSRAPGARLPEDAERRARREALLTPPRGGRQFLGGCVLPVLAGLLLAGAIAALSR